MCCRQARAVAVQQGKVEYLREEYATGKIRIGDLQRQEGLLQKMTVSGIQTCQHVSLLCSGDSLSFWHRVCTAATCVR